MDARRILYRSTEEALDSLGKSAKQMIMWQMSENGVDMAPDNFDIIKTAQVLNRLLGEGSETVLGMVYRNICVRLKADAQAHPDLPALERIEKIIEAKKMN